VTTAIIGVGHIGSTLAQHLVGASEEVALTALDKSEPSVGDLETRSPSQPFRLALQGFRRDPLGSKPATLHSLRASAAHPVSVRPQRLSVPTSSLQPDHLSLLRHHYSPLSARNA
jgi:hypothetical protein